MGIVSFNMRFTLNWIPFGTKQSASTLTSWGEAAFARKMCLAESKS